MIAAVIRHRIIIISAVIIITAFMGWRAVHIKTDMDFINYLPPEDADVQFFKDIQAKFGGNYVAMVLVNAQGDTVFTQETLRDGLSLHKQFEAIEGIRDVISIFNAMNIVKTEGGMEIGDLLPEIPETEEQLRDAQNKILSNSRFRGTLVSADEKTLAYVIRFRESAPKDIVAAEVIRTAYASHAPSDVAFAGFPMLILAAAEMMPKDMGTLIPIVLLVIVGTLYFGFRTVRGVSLPLLVVVITTVWTLGTMELAGVPLTMISSIIPVVLISVGSAYAIHVLNRYYIVAPGADNSSAASERGLREIWLPVALASVTSFIGFLSLLTATLKPIREFGLYTGVGTLYALLLSLTFLPACLATLRLRRSKVATEGAEAENHSLHKIAKRLGHWIERNAKSVVAVSVALFIGAAALLPFIHREMNMLSFFPEDSSVRKADEIMKQKFGGSEAFSIDVSADDVLSPGVQQIILDFQKWMLTEEHINNPQSVADLLAEMYDVMNGVAGLPETPRAVEGLWVLLDGQPMLDQMITKERNETIIQAQLDVLATEEVAKIHDRLKGKIADVAGQWRYSNIHDLSGDDADSFYKQRIQRVVRWIEWDIAAHAKTQVPPEKIREILAPWSQGNILLTNFADVVGADFVQFLKDNDIELSAPGIERMASALVQLEYPIREEAAAAILRAGLPSDLANDPMEVGFMADNLAKQINIRVRVAIAENVAQRLTDILSLKVLNKDLYEDLKQDAYFLTSSFLPTRDLPGEQFAVHVREGGNPFILVKMNEMLLNGQLQSIAVALGMVFLLLVMQLRSFRLGLLAIVPITNTVIILFGTMSLLGINLDTSTAMIASITIGVGVDYTIHFIDRFRSEVSRAGGIANALPETLAHVGVAVVINAVSVGVGFFVLVASEMVPMRNFGGLMLVGMLMSAFGALTLFPALLVATQPKAAANDVHKNDRRTEV